MKIKRSRGTGWRYWKAMFNEIFGGSLLAAIVTYKDPNAKTKKGELIGKLVLFIVFTVYFLFNAQISMPSHKMERIVDAIESTDDYTPLVFAAIAWLMIFIIGNFSVLLILLPAYWIAGFPFYKLAEHYGLESTPCYVVAGVAATVLLLLCGRIFIWATEKEDEQAPVVSYKLLAFLPAVTPLFLFAIGGADVLSAFLAVAVPALCLFAMWFCRRVKLALAIVGVAALAAIGVAHFATYKVLGRKPTMVKTELPGITLPDYNESKGCLLLLAGKKEGYEPLFESLMANGDSASALKLSTKAIGSNPKDTEVTNLCLKQLSALTGNATHAAAAKAALEKAYASDKGNPLLIRHHIKAMQEKGDTAATIEALKRGIASAKQQPDKNATLKYNMMLGDIYRAQGDTERYMATLREVVATGYYDAATFAAYYDLITSNGKNLKKGWSECNEAMVENSIYGKQQASPIYILVKAKIRFMEIEYISAEYLARWGLELVSEPDAWLLEFLGDVNLKLAEYLKQNRNISTGKSPNYHRKQAANYYEKAIEKSSAISSEALYDKLKAATK